MDDTTVDSGSPSLGDQERPLKRPRSSTSCSSGYQTPTRSSVLGAEFETARLRRELATAQKQLRQMEDTISQHVEIRERIIKVSENEKNILKSQLREARETIEELQEEVDIARRAQAAAEAGFPSVKTRMEIPTAMLMENTRMLDNGIYSRSKSPSTSSELEEDDAELLQYVKTEEELILSDSQDVEDFSTSQMQSNGRNIELNKGRSTIPRVNSNVLMLKEREASKASEIPVEKPKEKRSSVNDRLSSDSSLDIPTRDDQERLPTTPKSGDGEISCPRVTDLGFSSDSGDEDHSTLEKEGEKDEDLATKAQQRGDKLKLVSVGKYYSCLVSNRFFAFDWDDEYIRQRGMYVCKKCRSSYPNKQRLEDHVWTRHYKGKFFCPHCPNRSSGLLLRTSFHLHVQTKHPTLHQSEDFRKNIRNLRETV